MLARLTILALLVASALGVLVPQWSGRLGGGQDAARGEFPYQVSLQWTVRPNPEVHVCGGAILNKDWVLTAASCLDQVGDGYFRVVSGEHDFDNFEETEQEAIVDFFAKAPGYSSANFANDLAVLHLHTSLTINDFTKPILLPQPGAMGTGAGTVSGWNDMSQVLQGARVTVTTSCSPYVPYAALCSTPGTIYACQGDRGSPLAEVNTLGLREVLGVVAGFAPCAGGTSIIFTPVSNYIAFINSTIESYVPPSSRT